MVAEGGGRKLIRADGASIWIAASLEETMT